MFVIKSSINISGISEESRFFRFSTQNSISLKLQILKIALFPKNLFLKQKTSKMNCIKCSSDKIIKDQPIIYFSHGSIERNLSISIQKTDRAFFNKFEERDFLVQICGSCGNIEMTVNNPNALWEAYQESKK